MQELSNIFKHVREHADAHLLCFPSQLIQGAPPPCEQDIFPSCWTPTLASLPGYTMVHPANLIDYCPPSHETRRTPPPPPLLSVACCAPANQPKQRDCSRNILYSLLRPPSESRAVLVGTPCPKLSTQRLATSGMCHRGTPTCLGVFLLVSLSTNHQGKLAGGLVWFGGWLRGGFPVTLYKSRGFKPKSKPSVQTANLSGYLT